MTTWLSKAADFLSKIVDPLSRVVNRFGVYIIAVMMGLVTVDVLLRYALNKPVRGSFELIEYMMVIVVFFGMAYTALMKGHVTIDLAVAKLPRRAQAIINSTVNFIVLLMSILIVWQNIVQTNTIQNSNLTSAVLHIPVFPFLLVIAFGMAVFCLVFVIRFLNSVADALRK